MNDKKQLLITTALALFYKQGINSVGINEVLKVSGIAKKTLYNHFESKEALIVATLTARDTIFLTWLESQIAGATTNKEVVTRLFNALSAWFNNQVPQLTPFRGCFFINTSAEFSDKNEDILRYCAAHKASVRELIARHLPAPNDSLLDIICLLKEGAIVSAHTNQDLNAADKCIPLMVKWLNG